jgi:phosphatidate phosphatase APP1
MPFILIGDSGQEDPEIYRDVVHEHGDRILAVYIRNVSTDPARARAIGELAEEVRQAGSELLLSDDTLAASAARGRARLGRRPDDPRVARRSVLPERVQVELHVGDEVVRQLLRGRERDSPQP